MATNVLQVEVRKDTEQRVICDTIAKMFCDYGDVSVKRASDKIFWVDFKHFEQNEIDQIKLPAPNRIKEIPITNLYKIKTAVAKENHKVIEEIRFYEDAKRFPFQH